MATNRVPRGLLLAVAGAAVVAVATFEPWYGISVTPAGAAAAEWQLTTVAQQYGSPSLKSAAKKIGSHGAAVVGRPIATVSAHESLKGVSRALLLIAGAALLVALLRLAGMIEGGGGWIALVGSVGVIAVAYRIVDPPNPAPGFLSLSLSWGSWLALGAAGAIAAGGFGVGSPDGHL